MDATIATRLTRMETTIMRLVTMVETLGDAVANTQPMVLTKHQLQDAIRAAMTSADEEERTPRPIKKPKTRAVEDLPSPSSLSLSMLVETITESESRPVSPIPQPPRPTKRVAAVGPVSFMPTRSTPSMRAQQPTPVYQPPYYQPPQTVTPTPPARNTNTEDRRLFLWGDAWHKLPEDYEIPKESLEVMWRQWCCGVADQGIRALRDIRSRDIANTSNRKRLSDLKFLMKFIEQQLQDRGVWKEMPSEVEADQMLRAVRETLPFTTTMSKNGQKREVEELKWHSAVTLLRNAIKKARE